MIVGGGAGMGMGMGMMGNSGQIINGVFMYVGNSIGFITRLETLTL